MKKIFTLMLAFFLINSTNVWSQRIAVWTFETSAPTTSGPIVPETGLGTASGFHASTSTYSSPAGNGSAKSYSSNTWVVGDYYQFQVSTLTLSNIYFFFDQTGSNTGPNSFKVQYSTNGSTFTDFNSYTIPGATATTAYAWAAGTPITTTSFSFNLSSITALNNQAAIYLRIVCNGPNAFNGTAIGTAGTNRVDNVTISQGNVLPLNLLSFNGSLNATGNANLTWATANQVNSKNFEVQRSIDGKNFSNIGVVDATNNSGVNNYSYADNEMAASVNYYRLNMVDMDGKAALSNVIAINSKLDAVSKITVFPNPVVNTIIFSHPKAADNAAINVVGIDGKVLGNYLVPKGATQTSVSVNKLVKGNYVVMFSDSKTSSVAQFIKQ
jgi:hypothetical protein